MSILNEIFGSAFHWLYGLTGDWGLAIIAIAVVIRLALLPFTLKQKQDAKKMQDMSVKAEELRKKHKNDSAKLNTELAALQSSGGISALGCLVMVVQLPIFWSVYRVVRGIPAEAGSALLPWVASLALPDPMFILPILAVLVQILPQALGSLTSFKGLVPNKQSFGQVAMMTGISLIFLTQMPAAMALYWLSSSIVTSGQELVSFLADKA